MRDAFLSEKEFPDAIAARVIVCRKSELWKTRKNAVPGKGSPESQVMFIGEAPGYWEDIRKTIRRSGWKIPRHATI